MRNTFMGAALTNMLVYCPPSLAVEGGGKGLGHVFSGMASWYGRKFHGRKTASGKIFNENEYTCAHRTLPFGTRVVVTNPETGAQCYVTVTDRGPFHGHRVIDLSKAAARKIGLAGVGRVVCSTGHYIADRLEHKKAHVQTASSEGDTAAAQQKPAAGKAESEKSRRSSLASREISGTAKQAKVAPGDEMAKYLNSPYYVIEDSD